MTDDQKPPLHPGEILREEFMLPRRLSSNALAAHLGVTAARINEIAKEQRGITADTALRLARFFDTTPELWMDLQKHFELETAKRAVGDKIALQVTAFED